MRIDLIETFKFLGYVVFMPMFIVVGLIYKPLKWLVYKCSDFDKTFYHE